MAILRSGPAELEIRVLRAAHGWNFLAIDLRWNGAPLLNPAAMGRNAHHFADAPPGRLLCEEFWGDTLAATLEAVASLAVGEKRRRVTASPSSLVVTVARDGPVERDPPLATVAITFDADQFERVGDAAGYVRGADHMAGWFAVAAPVGAVARFGADLAEEGRARLQEWLDLPRRARRLPARRSRRRRSTLRRRFG